MFTETKNTQYSIKVKPEEWKEIRDCVGPLIRDEKIKLPCLLSAADLQKLFESKKKSKLFHHSVFVVQDENSKHGFRVGVTHRIDASFNKTKTFDSCLKVPKKLLFPSFLEESSSENYSDEKGELGRGKFGIVQVIKWDNDSIDALKITEEVSKEAIDNINNEEKILRKLNYLKIVFKDDDFVDIDLDDKKKEKVTKIVYSIQKLHPGIQASEYFKQCEAFTVAQEFVVASKIVSAIYDIHARDISHGDIHSGNLLINCDGDTATLNVAIIDFGAAIDLSVKKSYRKVFIEKDIKDIGRMFLQIGFKSPYLREKGDQFRNDRNFDETTLPEFIHDTQDIVCLYRRGLLKDDLIETDLIEIVFKIAKKEIGLEGLLENSNGSDAKKLGRICYVLSLLGSGSEYLKRVGKSAMSGDEECASLTDIGDYMEARSEKIRLEAKIPVHE